MPNKQKRGRSEAAAAAPKKQRGTTDAANLKRKKPDSPSAAAAAAAVTPRSTSITASDGVGAEAVTTPKYTSGDTDLRECIDRVIKESKQALDLLKNKNKDAEPQWMRDLRELIKELEDRTPPVPTVGFLCDPGYGKSFLGNMLLAGDQDSGPCGHSNKLGSGVTTIPVAFLSDQAELVDVKVRPGLKIPNEIGVYAIAIDGTLVDNKQFYEALDSKASEKKVCKHIVALTTKELEEVEVGMYVVRFPFKRLQIDAVAAMHTNDFETFTCRKRDGTVDDDRTKREMGGEHNPAQFSFIEVPGMETSSDPKVWDRLRLALSFVDIILVGLPIDSRLLLKENFLEPLRESAWLGTVEKEEELPSLVFCANPKGDETQAFEAYTLLSKDSSGVGESPLSNAYEVFSKGLNVILEDPRTGSGEVKLDKDKIDRVAMDQIATKTAEWKLTPKEISEHMLRTIDTFVFDTKHWDSVLAGFARMVQEKQDYLLELRQRDWAQSAETVRSGVTNRILSTDQGVQKNEQVAMKNATEELQKYTDGSYKKKQAMKFGFLHPKDKYQENPGNRHSDERFHPVGLRCDKTREIIPWLREKQKVVGYRALPMDILVGLKSDELKEKLARKLVEDLEGEFDLASKASRDSENKTDEVLKLLHKPVIDASVAAVNRRVQEYWNNFAVLKLEVCCRSLDQKKVFQAFIKKSRQAEDPDQLQRAAEIMTDYIRNISFLMEDRDGTPRFNDYTLLPAGNMKLLPAQMKCIRQMQTYGHHFVHQYIIHDQLPQDLNTLIDGITNAFKMTCDQLDPMDIPFGIAEDEEDSDLEDDTQGGAKKCKKTPAKKQKWKSRQTLSKLAGFLKTPALVDLLKTAKAAPKLDGSAHTAHPGLSAEPQEIAKVDNTHRLFIHRQSLQFPEGRARLSDDDETFDLQQCFNKKLLAKSGQVKNKKRESPAASALAKYCGKISKLSLQEEIIEPTLGDGDIDDPVDIILSADDAHDCGGTVTLKYTQFTKDKIKAAVKECITAASEPTMRGIYPMFIPSKDRSVTLGLGEEDKYVFPGHQQCNMAVESLFKEDEKNKLQYFAFVVVEKQELGMYKTHRNMGWEERNCTEVCKDTCKKRMQFITIPGEPHERLLGIGRIRKIIMLLAEHWGLMRYFQLDDDLKIGKEIVEYDFTRGVKEIVPSKLSRGLINLQMVLRRQVYPATADIDPDDHPELRSREFEPAILRKVPREDDESMDAFFEVNLVKIRAMELEKLKTSDFRKKLKELATRQLPPLGPKPELNLARLGEAQYMKYVQDVFPNELKMFNEQEKDREQEQTQLDSDADAFVDKVRDRLADRETREKIARDPTEFIAELSMACVEAGNERKTGDGETSHACTPVQLYCCLPNNRACRLQPSISSWAHCMRAPTPHTATK
eukprot:COSAG02_NODE_118_length_35376_cov_20.294923_19_plen_1403_part_00